jgi:hypothetical protein
MIYDERLRGAVCQIEFGSVPPLAAERKGKIKISSPEKIT